MPPSFTWSITCVSDAGFGLLVRDDDDRVVGPLHVQPFDDAANVAQVDGPLVHPDLAVRSDRDEDVAAFLVLGRQRLRAS